MLVISQLPLSYPLSSLEGISPPPLPASHALLSCGTISPHLQLTYLVLQPNSLCYQPSSRFFELGNLFCGSGFEASLDLLGLVSSCLNSQQKMDGAECVMGRGNGREKRKTYLFMLTFHLQPSTIPCTRRRNSSNRARPNNPPNRLLRCHPSLPVSIDVS